LDLASLGIDDYDLRQSLSENADRVAELVQEMAQNTTAINAQNDLVASNVLANNKVVQNSDF
jgi:hypothetical protein